MDSAIAPHFRCPRTRPKNAAEDFRPPVPAWTAWGDPDITCVVMAYYGVQWSAGQDGAAEDMIAQIAGQFRSGHGPATVEQARYTDTAGFENLIQVAYWTDVGRYHRFADDPSVSAWWNSADRETDGVGLFREIFLPQTSHVETLISSTDQLDGIAKVFGKRSEEDVQEHAYWGSMRDRLPASQTDDLLPLGDLEAAGQGRRVRVTGHDNIAVIRSGQDWSRTKGAERDLYLTKMNPILQAGMTFLSTCGVDIGCYSNRYLWQVDDAGAPLTRAFGLSYWRSLEHMEAWAEVHPTHVAIFDGFMNMVQELEGVFDLRLYHEVVVVKSGEQLLEYIGCHPATGMLAAVHR